MRLDASITELSTSGELTIDLSREVDVRLRLEPWDAGLRVYRWFGGLWLRELEDLGIALVNPANEAEPDLPVSRFTASIPAQVKAKVGAFQHLQTGLLQWSARSRAAAELLQRSPNLLWLLLCVATEECWPWRDIVQVLRLPRRHILRLLTGIDAEAAVGVLDRIVLLQGGWAEYRLIAGFLRDGDRTLWRALRGWPSISSPALAVYQRFPHLRDTALLRSCAARRYHRLWEGVAEARRMRWHWEDALRAADLLGITDANRALGRCETYEAVARLHDRWVEQLNLRLDRRHVGGVRAGPHLTWEGNRPFPPPPIPGNADIKPILSWEGLVAEGQIMGHCVASYGRAVQGGSSYIYQVLHPERATLELRISGDEVRIAQFKLSHNRTPAPASWQAVREWLAAAEGSVAGEPQQRQ